MIGNRSGLRGCQGSLMGSFEDECWMDEGSVVLGAMNLASSAQGIISTAGYDGHYRRTHPTRGHNRVLTLSI
jgi:hypothetical protein